MHYSKKKNSSWKILLATLLEEFLRNRKLVEIVDRPRVREGAIAFLPQPVFSGFRSWVSLVNVEYSWHNQLDLMELVTNQSPYFHLPRLIHFSNLCDAKTN